jgi:hypothetical protein
MEQVSLTIRAGRSAHQWPTKSASLHIIELWGSRVALSKGAVFWLDGEEVPAIGPDLEPYGRIRWRKQRLRENEGIVFQGSVVLGHGFALTPEQKDELRAEDSRNSEVIQPYVIGRDLNQRPDCSASKWIINFRGWTLERAEDYPDCLDIVRRLVKPERDQKKRKNYRELWWRYAERGPGLYTAIEGLDNAAAISFVSNAIMPVRVSAAQVFDHSCGVFAIDDFANLAVLSSSVHSLWVIRYTSTHETRIRYAPSDVFLTLPRPALYYSCCFPACDGAAAQRGA